MKIFIHAHYYLPHTLAGAEKFLHSIALYLADNGHEIKASYDGSEDYEFEGIKVVSNSKNINQYYVWADMVITHLKHSGTAINLAWYNHKLLFHLLHNNFPDTALLSKPANNFVIYNSEALSNELNLPLPSIVAHPAIDVDYWENDNDHFFNEYITLVNCAPDKGGVLLQQLAESMPGVRFMGVKGGYNVQIIQIPQTRNIQFTPPQRDMKKIYDQTRIIIMPSNYESWGMVASEAMASGIPVICSDTPGLRENCGDAAIYIAGQNVGAYREAINYLNDQKIYADHVRQGLKRNRKNDLDKILQFMERPSHGLRQKAEGIREKVENGLPIKEKREIPLTKEKQVIEQPGEIKKKAGRPKKKQQ